MDEKNTVTVVIYGQEYTISGDMSRDYILKIADHFDAKMREVGEGSAEPYSKVAVLAGMLCSDEYFESMKDKDELRAKNAELDENARNYEKMWEEVKQNFAQYKNDMTSLATLKDNLQKYAKEKEDQATALSQELAQEQKYNNELRARIEDLLAQKQAAEGV
ncbi:MAG: cell division protein ZapA, partial [Bacillota bacterium]|nr:cell division protein ZapA [Bacillota bacterium]